LKRIGKIWKKKCKELKRIVRKIKRIGKNWKKKLKLLKIIG
jgi:hypothetical protein